MTPNEECLAPNGGSEDDLRQLVVPSPKVALQSVTFRGP
jgi:hypothetical protein